MAPTVSASIRGRLRAVLQWIGAVVAFSILAYIAGANILLRTRILRSLLSADPYTLKVDYDSAYTFWPGRVTLKNIQIRGRDHQVEWLLRLPHARVNVKIFDLLRKRFHVSFVHGEGLSFRLRQRLEPATATPATTSPLPPIAGFSDPPLKEGTPSPPLDDAHYHLWTVFLEGVNVASVQEVWLDQFRYLGGARLEGTLFFKPLRRVEVHGSFDVGNGDVHLGEDAVASELVGRVDCTVDPFDPRAAPGPEPLQFMSGRIHLTGHIPNLRFLNYYWRDRPFPRIDSHEGSANTDLLIEHGILVPPSSSHLSVVDLSFKDADHTLDGSGDVDLNIAPGDHGKNGARLSADGRKLALKIAPLATFPIRIPTLTVGARSDSLDLRQPFSDLALFVESPRIEADLRAFNGFLKGSDFAFRAGEGSAGGRIDISVPNAVAEGNVHVETQGVLVHTSSMTLGADVNAQLKIASFSLLSHWMDLSTSHVEIKKVTVRNFKDPSWWAEIAIPHGRFRTSPSLFTAKAQARIKDAKPFLAFYTIEEGLPSIVRDLFNVGGLVANTEMTADSNSFAAHNFDLRGGPYNVRGEYRNENGAKAGAFLVSAGFFSVGVDVEKGSTNVKLFNASDWYRQAAAAIHAHVPNP